MARVFLSLGSNLGDKIAYLTNATLEIKKNIGDVLSCSPIYESEAIGFESPDNFYNICLEVSTSLEPESLLNQLHAIENSLGRTRNEDVRYSSRNIDIDILFYNDLIHLTDELIIPHPRYASRLFVLLPLNDLAPNYVDPVSRKSIQKTLQESALIQKINTLNQRIFY